MTTGITDVDWLDAKVCELSAENERLREALGAALEDILNSDDPGAIRIIQVALANEREEGEGE